MGRPLSHSATGWVAPRSDIARVSLITGLKTFIISLYSDTEFSHFFAPEMAYSRPQNRSRVSESIVLTYGKWSRISPPISGPPAKNQKTVFIANLDVDSSTVLVLISVLDLRRCSTTERPLSHSVTGWAEFRGDIAPHRSESVHFSQVYDIKFSRLFVPEIAYSGSKNREEPVPCIRINRLDLWEGPWVILRRVESRFGVISLLPGPIRWLLCHFSSTHSTSEYIEYDGSIELMHSWGFALREGVYNKQMRWDFTPCLHGNLWRASNCINLKLSDLVRKSQNDVKYYIAALNVSYYFLF
jgi:hypothetical protein